MQKKFKEPFKFMKIVNTSTKNYSVNKQVQQKKTQLLTRKYQINFQICFLIRAKTPEDGQLVLDAFCNFIAFNNKFDQQDRDSLYEKLVQLEAFDSCVQYLQISRYISSFPNKKITDSLIEVLDQKQQKDILFKLLKVLTSNPFIQYSESSLLIMEKNFKQENKNQQNIQQNEQQQENQDKEESQEQSEQKSYENEQEIQHKKIQNLRSNFEYLNNQFQQKKQIRKTLKQT